ncbi:MAG TPA: SpoIIE family protein phosphatase [Acidimicrobiia bacterium]|nr:SpoIIE family protein phosphatase [Acidimicrobiia bacterium]
MTESPTPVDDSAPVGADLGRVWITVVLVALTVAGVLFVTVAGIRQLARAEESAVRSELAAEVAISIRRTMLALQDERGLAELWLVGPSPDRRAAFQDAQEHTDAAVSALLDVWRADRSTLDDAGPPDMEDLVESTRTIPGLRVAILRLDEDSSVESYTGIVGVLGNAARRMELLAADSGLSARIRALVRIMEAGQALSEKRDFIVEILSDESRVSQDELIRVAQLGQAVRTNLGAVRTSGAGDLGNQVGSLLASLPSDDAQRIISSLGMGDESVSAEEWSAAVTRRLDALRAIGDDLEQALQFEADGQADAAARARVVWGTWLIVFTIVALFAGGAAVAAARQRSMALREHGELAAGLYTWFSTEQLSTVEGVTVTARYDAAAEFTRAGGDWYDVYVTPDGRVALTIGDVAGHGASATAQMAQARNLLRGICLASRDSPAIQLQVLDDALRSSGMMATVFHGLLDIARGELTYTRAGHLAGLRRDNEMVTILDDALGSPLGVGSRTGYVDARVRLSPGSQVVLFTDGMVEERGGDVEEAIGDIARRLAEGPQDIDRIADELISRRPNQEDDAALLVLKWQDSDPVTLWEDLPAAPVSSPECG